MISKITYAISGHEEYVFSYRGYTYVFEKNKKAVEGWAVAGVISEKTTPAHSAELWFYNGWRAMVVAAFLKELGDG